MSKSAKHQSVQDRLRSQRVIRGLSVADLAGRIGCSTRYLFLLEAGDRLPSKRIARRWSRVLGSDISATWNCSPNRSALEQQRNGSMAKDTKPTEAMIEVARTRVFPALWKAHKHRYYYTGEPSEDDADPQFAELAFAAGMAYAAALIDADLLTESAKHESPKRDAIARAANRVARGNWLPPKGEKNP